jgi:hypothetical protein
MTVDAVTERDGGAGRAGAAGHLASAFENADETKCYDEAGPRVVRFSKRTGHGSFRDRTRISGPFPGHSLTSA